MDVFKHHIPEQEPVELAQRILDLLWMQSRIPAVHESALRIATELLPYRASRLIVSRDATPPPAPAAERDPGT